MIVVHAEDFGAWREEARKLLAAGASPEEVHWRDGTQTSLFDAVSSDAPRPYGPVRAVGSSKARTVPASFIEKARIASFHGDPQKYAVLYRLLWKLTHENANVLDDPLDPDTQRLRKMLREVREEEHDMHAFVRFRQSGDQWVAWYRPKHPVLPRVAPFFARRYPNMSWTLFTPSASAHWDGTELRFGPGAGTEVAPKPDALDELFLTYYANIFNPARTNLAVLQKHIPARVQAQLPEGAVMDQLARGSVTRVQKLARERTSASSALLPERRDLDALRAAAHDCRACPIGERATQTVFGEGPADAMLMIVGEQPGDEEDRTGLPFVGPAGRLLADLLAKAGLDRARIYVTNAVKHFKWEPRGKRRIHARPHEREVEACHGWLLAEVAAVRPRMILCLGATAAQSFAGSGFRVSRDRGKPTSTPWSAWWMASYHPSALLRAETPEQRQALERSLLEDLVRTKEALEALSKG